MSISGLPLQVQDISYQYAAEDIEYFTGMQVSRSAQQRLVHRQNFALPEIGATVEEISVDGGNIRIRTPVGDPCDWKGYKAICLHEQVAVAASFRENAVVIDWVNAQPLAAVLIPILFIFALNQSLIAPLKKQG